MSNYPRHHLTAAALTENAQRDDLDDDATEGRDVLDIVAAASRPQSAAAPDHAHDPYAQVAR